VFTVESLEHFAIERSLVKRLTAAQRESPLI
jgi:hypothetical protein